MVTMTENEIARIVLDAGLKVHRQPEPGLLKSAYEECLYFELVGQCIFIEKQKALPLVYHSIKLDTGKAVEALNEIHLAQVLTYLKLSNCKLGLRINFNVLLFKDGVKRVINGSLT